MAPDPLRQAVVRAVEESIRVQSRLLETCGDQVVAAGRAIAERIGRGGCVFLCGNGGAAATCEHLAAELVGRLSQAADRRPLPAVALTSDGSTLLALANDYGFESVFARQVEALLGPEDLLLAISTSGRSANVLAAVEVAASLGAATIALTGSRGPLARMVSHPIVVPASDPQRIQEASVVLQHALCGVVEEVLRAAVPSSP
jgi:D-sedoheptulose 7-phosphate isomerase